MRKALPLLALVLLAGAIFVLRLPSGSTPDELIDPGITPAAAPESEQEARLAPVTDRGARDAVEVLAPPIPMKATEGPETPTEEFEVTDSATVATHEPWMLELRVMAPTRTGETVPPAEVQVRARLDGDPFATGGGVRASCAIGQVTSIDIGSFRGGAQEPAMLSITATHPSLAADAMNVELIAEHVAPGDQRAPVQATLQLRHALTITGTVAMASEDPPFPPGTRARVGAWESRGGRPTGDSVVADWVSPDGTYSLLLPATGKYFVAAAEASSLADGRACEVTNAAPNAQLEPLVLGVGASISGQFVAGEDPPPKRVVYRASRPVEGPTLRFEEIFGGGDVGAFVWTRGGLVRSGASGTSQEDGKFVLGGLAPGPYELSVHGLAEGHYRSEATIWEVQAPASDLLFDIGLSIVAVKFVNHPTEPPPREMKLFLTRPVGTERGHEEEEIRCEDGKFWWGDAEAEFLFTPLAPVRFRLAVNGAEDIVRDLITPRSGKVAEVVLHVPVGTNLAVGDLRLRLTGDVPPDGTSFVVHASQLTEDRARDTFRKTSDGDAHVLESVNGELAIQGLPIGVTRLAVYPATWIGHRASHHLDTIMDVPIKEDIEVVADLELVLGGRLRISKPNAAGGYHSDKCTIRLLGGEPIPVQFIAYAANGGGAWGSDDSLLAGAPSLVMPNLEPGTYEVQVGDETRTVAVLPGEIVDLVLE